MINPDGVFEIRCLNIDLTFLPLLKMSEGSNRPSVLGVWPFFMAFSRKGYRPFSKTSSMNAGTMSVAAP